MTRPMPTEMEAIESIERALRDGDFESLYEPDPRKFRELERYRQLRQVMNEGAADFRMSMPMDLVVAEHVMALCWTLMSLSVRKLDTGGLTTFVGNSNDRLTFPTEAHEDTVFCTMIRNPPINSHIPHTKLFKPGGTLGLEAFVITQYHGAECMNSLSLVFCDRTSGRFDGYVYMHMYRDGRYEFGRNTLDYKKGQVLNMAFGLQRYTPVCLSSFQDPDEVLFPGAAGLIIDNLHRLREYLGKVMRLRVHQ